jgi:regulator of sigma E protease
VFSVGFGPVLVSRTDRHGTRWQLAAIPFGGYVKFMGDADAASGKDGAAIATLTPEQRRATMHGAPLWARAATVAAGPIFNFVLTFAIFLAVLQWNGVGSDEPVVGEVQSGAWDGPNLQPGDRVISVAGTATPDSETLFATVADLPPSPTVSYEVERDGQVIRFDGPYPFPPLVSSVQTKSAALDAGLQEGDVILAIGDTKVTAFSEMPALVEASNGAPLTLTVWRAGETFLTELTPRRRDLPLADGGFETRWLIGLSGAPLFTPETRRPGLVETVTLSASQTWNIAATSLSALWHIVTGAISTCNLSGPIGMAEVMGDAARSGVESFVMMLAVLSVGIGLMNLFPIPVLDGGHLVFHAYEAVTRRPPSDGAMRVLMGTGLFLILSLMFFGLTNDLFCV